MTTETTAQTAKAPKTAMITLTANGTVMRIRARRKSDGTAETFVTMTDAAKKTERGMTETHPTFDAATAAIAASATKAEKLGWIRRVRGPHFVAKPDAFATLPTPPKKVPAAPSSEPSSKKSKAA
jgi:hypothetical protein